MLEQLIASVFKADFLFSVIRITAPILFAALAAVVAEKAGVVNIGLEGIMMITALFGFLFAYWTQSWIIGVLGAVVVGALLGLLMGFFSFKLKTDIILAGIAVNMLGGGGTIFLLNMFTGLKGNTGALVTSNLLIPTFKIPLISKIPILGEILSGHAILTYLAFLFVWLTWMLLYKTPLGLDIRAVGENPDAASSVGVSVLKIRYMAILVSGGLAGLGGAFMSLYYSQGWNSGMVAGRGFIALAAQAMGRGEPVGAMLSSLLFGLAQALRTKVSGLQGVSSYLVSLIPYLTTIVGLVLYVLSTRRKTRKHQIQPIEG
ncbi:MAG: ABC transporter permease [Clostridiales bacterium]|jgi:simple sugar transport system permease protein|nr:ABC transporter permease [Clostridiales bacterium]MDD2572633.1 ABC transporter permease [Eubacteriales bacterium]MDY0119083.1 ABC transporter permease [Clostridia bacterium]NLG29666.1 ABC transporter permease [Clostridiaceae bacterium]MCK9350619.1 ABC transporter permease [Clostridiales bacterium]